MYLRDVVEEPRYSQDLDDLRRRYPNIDQVQSALSWELSNNPTKGDPLREAPDFRLYTTGIHDDMPAFFILYTYDTNKIYLHSIQPVRDD